MESPLLDRHPLNVAHHFHRNDEALDHVLDEAAHHAVEGNLAAAARVIRVYRRSMTQRLLIEEEVLFPYLDRRAGLASLTGLMRDEHRQLRWLVDRLCGALDRDNAERFLTERLLVNALLLPHRLKEARAFYPLADRLLLDGERRDMVDRLDRTSSI